MIRHLKYLVVFFGLVMVSACGAGGTSSQSEVGSQPSEASSQIEQSDALDDYGQSRDEVIALLEEIAAAGQTISGQQVNEYEVFIPCDSMDYIEEMTGETPALLGLELMFAMEYEGYEGLMLQHAEDHAAKGGLVTFTWHARNPIKVCPRGEFYECSQYAMTDEELDRVLTPGTQEHALWLKDLDATAEILQAYADQNITTLFRPFHEMNGGWFWWGQKARYTDLWDMTYERITGHHGITNMIWVWGADKAAEGAAQYYPGDETVDFVGTDFYAASTDDAQFMTGYGNIQPLHERGTFSITEVGIMPNYEIFREIQPLWFLQWGGSFMYSDWDYAGNCDRCSPEGHVEAVYQWPEVLSLSELPMTDGMAAAIDKETALASAPDRECPLSLLD